jgi:Fur family ferric uptake transcriptional regulator
MSSLKDEAEERLVRFLKETGKRVTPARFKILNAALAQRSHFTAEDLYIDMKKRDLRVSRATVYNNAELLAKCGILAKRNFGDGFIRYESAMGKEEHGHIIFAECGTIREFRLNELSEIFVSLSAEYDIEITGYSLNLFCSCRTKNCAECGKPKNNDEELRAAIQT